jgi:spore germination protein YaaH
MVRALVAIARGGPYSGLDLDFEDFAVDARHNAALAYAAAALFPPFVTQVCAALHALHDSCAVTVMPRTSATPTYWRGKLATWVYDYAALAADADRVQVMAYDDNAPGGPAGPVAPYAWVQQVISYAESTMPAGKVELALPAYGYDWSAGGAAAVTAQEAAQLAAAHGVKPRWDAAQREETFAYKVGRQRHVVWYEDAAADDDRAQLARAAGFAGIDLWSAGDEDPGVWPLLRRLYA